MKKHIGDAVAFMYFVWAAVAALLLALAWLLGRMSK